VYAAGYRGTAGTSNDVWLRSFDTRGAAGPVTISYGGVIGGSDIGQDLAIGPMGELIIAGHETVFDQGNNIWVRQHSPAGATQWTGTYNAANSTDHARSVAVDPMGNVVAVGFVTVGGQRDLWFRYYNSAGTAQWTGGFAGAEGLNDEGWGVAFDSAGNVVIAGYESTTTIPWRTYLAKYDPLGTELWAQSWDGELAEGAVTYRAVVDSADDIVVTGESRRGGYSDLLVRKYDTNGVARWTTTIEGAAETHQTGRGLAFGPNNRIWVAGGIDQGVDGRDIYVARIAP